jgi:hypothetical protein
MRRFFVTFVLCAAVLAVAPPLASASTSKLNLALGLGADTANPSSGGTITYDFAASAPGNFKKPVTVRVDLDPGVQFVEFTQTGDFTCTASPGSGGNGGSVTCVGPVTKFTTGIPQVYFTVLVTAPSGSTINTSATIDPDNVYRETDETDNTVSLIPLPVS